MATVNFSIDDSFGQLLTDIAQEKLLYDFDIQGGLRVLSDSGINMPDVALDILFGRIQLGVEDNKYLVPINESKPLPIIDRFDRKYKEIQETTGGLLRSLEHIPFDYELTLPWHTLIEVLENEDFDIEEEIRNAPIVEQLDSLLRVVRNFLDETFRFYRWSAEIQNIVNSRYQDLYCREVNGVRIPMELDVLMGPQMVQTRLAGILKGYHEGGYKSFAKDLQKFTDAMMEISSIEFLTPSDTLKDAGWLSPDGIYYGLDGEISNMLHNQIADFLLDQGVIPTDYSPEGFHNPDKYLNETGWIRQHDNWLLTDAYHYDKEVTQEQLKVLTRLMRDKHRTVIVGFERKEFTMGQIMMMDKIMLRRNFKL